MFMLVLIIADLLTYSTDITKGSYRKCFKTEMNTGDIA